MEGKVAMTSFEYINWNFDALGRAEDAKLHVTSSDGATKYINVTPEQVQEIRRILLSHCFRENNCAKHPNHIGSDCCCCGLPAEQHIGCDCEPEIPFGDVEPSM